MTDNLKDYVRRQWERDKAKIEREAIDNYIASPEFEQRLAHALQTVMQERGGPIEWSDNAEDIIIAMRNEKVNNAKD